MLNKILRLERPLAVFDLETTGLDPEKDRILQIAITIHYPNRDPIRWFTLINPEVPITNTGKHRIDDLDLIGCYKCKAINENHPTADCAEFVPIPTFRQIAPNLAPKILNVDICGYNPRDFDVKFMKAEMKRAGVEWPWNGYIIDPLQIYRFRRGHSLVNCYLEFGGENGEPLPRDTPIDDAHSADFDVMMTEKALYGQLLRFQDLPRTVKELSAFCFPHPENAVDEQGKFVWIGNDAAFNFGKWRGRLLKDPECKSYLKWMFEAGNFSEEVKDIAEGCLFGIFPERT